MKIIYRNKVWLIATIVLFGFLFTCHKAGVFAEIFEHRELRFDALTALGTCLAFPGVLFTLMFQSKQHTQAMQEQRIANEAAERSAVIAQQSFYNQNITFYITANKEKYREICKKKGCLHKVSRYFKIKYNITNYNDAVNRTEPYNGKISVMLRGSEQWALVDIDEYWDLIMDYLEDYEFMIHYEKLQKKLDDLMYDVA